MAGGGVDLSEKMALVTGSSCGIVVGGGGGGGAPSYAAEALLGGV
jgi:hypothetical protein